MAILAVLVLSAACEIDAPTGAGGGAGDCASLESIELERAQVARADAVAAGEYTPPVSPGGNDVAPGNLPGFCRVQGTASPVDGSVIGFEVWLPASTWNGRLLMLGNGGYSSSMPYRAMAAKLVEGYVLVATDTGHSGDDPDFARDAPESITDWGHRAVHVSLLHARTIVRQYYGRPPHWSYFTGCSTGGGQALMSAQRYPDDFDGIVAGAPGHNRTHLNAGFLWQFLQNHVPGSAEPILPPEMLSMISAAVLESCRANNGTVSGGLPGDPYLDDPLACEFDPASLQCADGDTGSCLTPAQVEVVRAIYDGPVNPRTGERIYFGQLPGSESAGGPPVLPGWSLYWADPRRPTQPARASFWQYWVFDGAEFDPWAFDFDEGMRIADDRLAGSINAMNPDLSAFRESGGKLIHFHGLSDPVVPATDSIAYHDRVRNAVGPGADSFYRLFLMPGVEHCRGGPGPDSFDPQAVLEAWVERGEAPDAIIATHRDESGEAESSRPLCPYPAYAVYRGSGPSADAENFTCAIRTQRPAIPAIGRDYMQ